MSVEAIKKVQQGMKDKGFYTGNVDGAWGNLSQTAWDAMLSKHEDVVVSGLDIAWSAKVSPEFVAKVKKIVAMLRMPTSGADDMMACMAWESAETFSPSVKNAAGSGACVDTETEILTTSGWKKYNEVNVGDDIYSLNLESLAMERDSILDMVVKESDNNYLMRSRSFDAYTTHDHKWPLMQRHYSRTDNSPTHSIKTTEEIYNLKSSYSYSLLHQQEDYVNTIEVLRTKPLGFYRLLGFIAGDGCIHSKNRKIELNCWSKNTVAWNLIERSIEDVFGEDPVTLRHLGKDMLRWVFSIKQVNELITAFDIDYNSDREGKFIKKLNPEIFSELDADAANALLEGYMYSDGHHCKSNNTRSFRNTERAIINDFMHVAILAGENPREVSEQQIKSGFNVENRKPVYTVYLRDSRYTSCAHHQLSVSLKTEKITVWCPTTRNHTWLARRNGTVYWTHNCGLIQFMPKTAIGLGTTVDKLAALTAEQQLDYVYKYFEPYAGKLKNLGDLYMAILWPAGVGKADSFVLWDAKSRPTTYRQNAGLDINKDNVITRAEALAKVNEKLIKGMKPENRRSI